MDFWVTPRSCSGQIEKENSYEKLVKTILETANSMNLNYFKSRCKNSIIYEQFFTNSNFLLILRTPYRV